MVVAGEGTPVAGLGQTQLVAPVGTGVEENVYPAVGTARHNDAVLTHVCGDEITRLRHLAFVSHEQPSAREDALHLQAVDGIVPVHAPVDAPAVEIDQATQFGRVGNGGGW